MGSQEKQQPNKDNKNKVKFQTKQKTKLTAPT